MSGGPSERNWALRTARKREMWTQEQAVEEVSEMGRRLTGQRSFSVSVRQWRRWEQAGPALPHGDTMEALCKTFGVESIEELGFVIPLELRPAASGAGGRGGVMIPL